MEIVNRKISELKAADYNPRRLTEKQADDLKASITTFGKMEPAIVNMQARRKNIIISGHQRLKVAASLGFDEWPCIEVKLSLKKEKELNIRMNKNTGEWDLDLLEKHFDLPDLKDWGFNDLDFSTGTQGGGLTDENDIPPVPKEAVTKPGDLYALGLHVLLCGDSTNQEHVERLMDGEKADMVFTDPPYNIDFKPQRGTHDKILNDAMTENDFSNFLDAVFSNCFASLNPDTLLFVWCGWSTTGDFQKSLQKLFEVKALHIWVKNNFGIGYYSRPKYEPFFLCLNGKPIKPSKAPADVWECAKVHKTIHSCEKPVLLIENILGTYDKNGTILDLFGGSGSTLIASEKTGRKCKMMELDPIYCDVIIKRYEDYTGNKAELIQPGGA